MQPAEQIAAWADRLRDMAATGLAYAASVYDRDRYAALQSIAIEMTALAAGQPIAAIEPLRSTVMSRFSPITSGVGAVIDGGGLILLVRRADNGRWAMPGGVLEVGETPAAGVAREVFEETGLRCQPIALVGVYDSRVWDRGMNQQIYKFTFLCAPLDQAEAASHAGEILDRGWFAEDGLPDEIHGSHRPCIAHAFAAWRGDPRAHFDP